MGKVIRLTESELIRLVKRVISESEFDDILDNILGRIKNKLSDMGIDVDDMDTTEILDNLVDVIQSTNNERLKHELTKLYYEFKMYFGNKNIEEPSTIRRPEPKRERRSNPNFKFDYEDGDYRSMKKMSESDLRRIVKIVIKEEEEEEITKEDRVKEFLNSDEIRQDTGEWSFTLCDESDWDRVKEYIMGSGRQERYSNPTAKQVFLSRNEDITEEEFDSAYDSWLDYIEDQRGYEFRNREDFNY